MTRDDCLALDRCDPLAPQRAAFALPEGVIYLDGNSLGALPRATAARVRQVIEHEWGERLIRSWDEAHWVDAPRRIGAHIARLIGAEADEVICGDSTSINLFKVLACALHLQRERPRVAPKDRHVILSERHNFPTDLYIAQGLSDMLGRRYTLKLADFDQIAARIDPTVAVLMLTHVNYRTGAMHDMAALTRRAQDAGCMVIWDLAHSAGAVPVDLNGCNADFAIGCGYKYLNGGPGAPAFVFAARRNLQAAADDVFAQPLSGWFGHRAPFVFAPAYDPAATIDRFAVGTPPIIGLAALEIGVETVLAAGSTALREKSVALTQLFIELVESRCGGHELQLLTPRAPAQRGSQVSFTHPHAWPVMQALIARGVIGDVRAAEPGQPAILRFGFAPLYLRHVDVWDAAEQLREVLASRAWDRPEFHASRTVT